MLKIVVGCVWQVLICEHVGFIGNVDTLEMWIMRQLNVCYSGICVIHVIVGRCLWRHVVSYCVWFHKYEPSSHD